jgi:hypothetical protein
MNKLVLRDFGSWLAVWMMLFLWVHAPVVQARADQAAEGWSYSCDERSFSVYALSRGKGVPPRTRETFEEMVRVLKTMEEAGQVVKINKQRIGLEGETRLCVEFSDKDSARQAWLEVKNIGKGIELLDYAIGPCDGKGGDKGARQ